MPKKYTVSTPPNSIDDTRSAHSWQELFKARRAWALKVVEDCRSMAGAAHERYGELEVMLRCLDAAVANLESVIRNLEPKHAELMKWVPDAQADYTTLTTGWEQYLSLARSIPISSAMVRYMTGRDNSGSKGRPQRQSTLEDLVDLETARRAGRLAPAALRKFSGRVADLDKAAARLFQGANDLFREYEGIMARSAMSHDAEAVQLLQDIEAVANKVDTDCQTAQEYSNSSRDILQASKIAATHTERLLPSIRTRALEMDELVRYVTQARNNLAAESIEVMRTITDLTSLSHSVKSQMSAVNQEDELATFDYLRLIQQVPYMYASFVAEALQRREWLEKVRQDSSTLANEMALFQDEEVKRRRRWHKSVGMAYGPNTPTVESKVPGLEVNLLGEDEQWPVMNRADLDEFYNLLQAQKADAELLNDIGKLIAGMSSPTRQQSKRMKAFKNGSVHEAALGRSGLLIRGDDDLLRSLQEDKSKLESKLKTAESRVRRLEDLLHRQTQASRPSLGNLFQMPSQQLSDRNDSTISVKSPRISEDRRRSLEGTDGLLLRIQALEADLQAEKERSAVFEKDFNARVTLHDDIKGQMEEANSTKKDLLENMEALKREFVEERKSLEEEIKRLQARLEDTEDEIEHFGESRENEKVSHNEKVRALELEIESLRKERQDEVAKSDSEAEGLWRRIRLQQEQLDDQAHQLQVARQGSKGLSLEVVTLAEKCESLLSTIQDIWRKLSPDERTPEDVEDLIDGVSGKIAEVLAKVRSCEGDIALLNMDLESAQSVCKALRAELTTTNERLSKEEVVSMSLQESLTGEKAKVGVLERELADGREQLSQWREKFADGEAGSESLRRRLEEQEERLTSMAEEFAARQSQASNLEEEVRVYKERFQDAQAKLMDINVRFDSRTEHAKDLSQRLYTQNERLTALLERLGYSITRQGATMVIQKLPRSERSAQNAADVDLSSSLRRSGTLTSRKLPDSSDLELLHWTDSANVEAESSKYESFLASLGSFDVDATCDTLYRRVKDVEHLARKLQRDARGYRERAHTLQKDSHDKIAFKNFKEGDLALFLPTRNQAAGAWAAFNIGFPHYFLREQEAHRLRSREWLVARISRIQERVVDLSKSLQHQPNASSKPGALETDSLSEENDNPFDLSDGLRWYLIDAVEDKSGAPSTPGLAKSTVASNNVDVMADIHTHGRQGAKSSTSRGGIASGIEGVSKSLSKSLESRRSSTGSKKALPFTIAAAARGRDSALASETNSLRAVTADTPVATSPTQPHSALQSTLPQLTGKAAGPLPGESRGLDAPAGQRDHQPTEVRNDMDFVVGP